MAVAALQAHPDAVGIACTNSVSPRGAAEALRTLHKVGTVKVWGLGLPSENRNYLKEGSVTGLYLWDSAAAYLHHGQTRARCAKWKGAERRRPAQGGIMHVNGPLVTLPLRLEITKENVDSLKF